MKMNKKGFTLIEMLVVIAIIAVLVSIVIPVVGNSTEKAKEAADAANIRSAIAEVTTTVLGGANGEKIVKLSQTGAFENLGADATSIGGYALSSFTGVKAVKVVGTAGTNSIAVYTSTDGTTFSTTALVPMS